MKKKKVVVIVGLSAKALAVCRLMRQSGWEVYCLYTDREDYGEFRYSRAINHIKKMDDDYNVIANEIRVIHNANKDCKFKIILTTSAHLAQLRENMPYLWKEYHISSGPIEALNIVANKHKFYEFCKANGIPTVPNVVFPQYEPGCLKFPIVVKHNVESVIIKEKCKIIDSEDALRIFVSGVPNEIRNHLVLQEYIDKDFIEIDYRGYIENGCVIGRSIVESLRMKPIGVSSYLEEITDKGILNVVDKTANKIFEKLHYSGFVGMDIKYRKTDGMLYILDFNPRAPGSFSEWVMKYDKKDLIKLFSSDYPVNILIPKRQNIRWVNLIRDLRARKEQGDWKGLYKSFTAKYDVWDIKDPLPFLLMWPYMIFRWLMNKKTDNN